MNDTQQIKDKIDIVDFINDYVPLKPAGNSHKGLCPFHNEKSPSFMVSRDRQSFYCFGCNKGGDVFTFVQEMESMSFVESLKFLAQKAGVVLTERFEKQDDSQKNRLKNICTEVARFYHKFLMTIGAAREAREYLKSRGLTKETVEHWHIGFAAEQWDLQTKYLLKKGFSIDDLVASGITIKRDGADAKTGRGYYDRFRGRVMFPIRDVHGSVVGFTGRVLKETETSGGKYVNTPQTLIYDKSSIVFGLDKAKQAIRKAGKIVVVEGQMDVISCHQAGMENVVASSGTALTQEQISLLKRYATTMCMAFDADEAGQNAAKRGIDLALESGMGVKVIRIPDGAGKDPDECVKKNKDVWFQAVEQAQDVMTWYIERAFTGKDLKDPKQKQLVANILLPEVARIPFAIEQDHWVKEVAGRLGVDVAVLREDMKRVKNPQQPHADKEEKKALPVSTKVLTRMEILSEQVFLAFLRYPSFWPTIQPIFPQLMLTHSSCYPLYELVKKEYSTLHISSPEDIRLFLEQKASEQKDALLAQLNILLLKADEEFSGITDGEARREVEARILSFQEERKKERRKTLQKDIEQAERSGDTERLVKLLQEFQQLQSS